MAFHSYLFLAPPWRGTLRHAHRLPSQLLTCVAIGAIWCYTPANAAPNLLDDPGFENVSPDGGLRVWQPNTAYPFTAVDVVRSNPNCVRSGDTAVTLTQTNVAADGTDVYGSFFTAAAIPVAPLVDYTLSFWARGDGKVSATLYGYNDQGNVYEPFSLTPVKTSDDPAPDTLVAGKPWRQFLYTFRLASKDTKVKSVRFVIAAHGTVHVDDCGFMRADAATPATPPPAPTLVSRPNLLGINRAAQPPRCDGRIEPNEYPNRASGLIDCNTQALYPQPSAWHLGYDETNLYFAFTLQIPAGTTLDSAGAFRDDSALIAASSAFYLYIRPDRDVSSKTFAGVYLGVAPSGVLYDAWETMDHPHLDCKRDATFNARWQVATSQQDGQWTLELAVPWQDLRLPAATPGQTYALSFGMHANNQRLAWQSHPTWFDYPQAFGLLRLLGDAPRIETPSLTELNRGDLSPRFRLENASAQPAPYDLAYVVSSVRMTEGSVGTWVLDVVGDVKQREAVAATSLFHWQRSGTVAPGGHVEEEEKAKLKDPGYYVLELEARTGDASCFYQKIPFHAFPPIVAELVPVPSKDQVLVQLSFYGAATADRGTIRVAFQNAKGKEVHAEEAQVRAAEMELPVSMADLPPGEYQVALVLVNPAGQEVARRMEKFRKWETPVWLKHREGIEALAANWVPAPWTPVKVEGGRWKVLGRPEAKTDKGALPPNTSHPTPLSATCVSVWGRTFDFADGSLLAGLNSQGTPLLATGMSAHYLAAGKEQAFTIGKPRFPLKKRGRVEVAQQGTAPDFTLSSKARVEFDGLIRYDMTITPSATASVERLWIDIPFAAMPYAHYSDGDRWQTGLTDSQTFAGPGRWYQFWTGNDKVGCSFFVENHKGWLIDSSKPRIVLQTEGNRRVLRLLIVNTPTMVKAPMTFTFALHPTPIKPFFKNWRDIRADGLGMGKPPINLSMIHSWAWNSGDSKPAPRNWQAMDDMMAYLHGQSQRVYPYLGTYYLTPYNCVRPDAPFVPPGKENPPDMIVKARKDASRIEEYFYYKHDWDLTPPIIQDVGMETQQEVRTSPSSSYADYFVYGIAEMLRRSKVDGIYCDIPTSSMDFSEEKGNTYKTLDGVTEGTYEIFENRDLYKRLYYVFDKLRGEARKPYILGHGTSFFPGVVSFWDVVFHGEELKPTEPFGCTKMYLQKSGAAAPLATPDATDANRTYDAFYYRSFFGSQGGMPMLLLPQYGYQVKLYKPEFSRELLSFTFLHNTLLWPAYIPPQPVLDFWNKVEVPFGMGDTTFYPHWENGVVTQPAGIKVSYWKKDGREEYLVGVANWSSQSADATVELPAPLAVFSECRDMESGATLKAGSAWKVTVPAHDLRAFRFGGVK